MPDVGEPFLKGIFGFPGIVHYTKGHTVKCRRKTLVKSPESSLIALSNSLDERNIKLAFWVFHCQGINICLTGPREEKKS